MAKRFCVSCGNELEDGILFCTKCGTKVEVSTEVVKETKKEKKEVEEVKEEIKTIPEKPKKKHTGLIIFIIILLLALAGFLLWFFVLRDDSSSEEEKTNDIVEEKKDNKKEEKPTKVEKEKFTGYLYQLNEGYGWVRDSSNKYYYLVDEDGKVIKKVDYSYYSEDPVFIDGYSQLLDNIYNTKGEVVLSKEEAKLDEMRYAGNGLVIVKVTEENYKGTSTKMGIYDLNQKDYTLALDERIYDIRYIDEGMFILDTQVDGLSNVSVYNSKTRLAFSIGDRFDVLIGTYKDEYISYREINSDKVYLLDKSGKERLVYTGKKHVTVGQFSDGLVYIDDAFYDIDGNKVIDLKDEGVRGAPEFVNGYALIYFDTGYFTILSKESKEYVFTPRKYTSMSYYYGGDYELGIFEGQNKLTKDGYLLVKTSEDKKVWAIMNHDGKIIAELPVGVSVFSSISNYGYVAVDGSAEDYYFTADKEEVKIEK